jgi:hypothetical protein
MHFGVAGEEKRGKVIAGTEKKTGKLWRSRERKKKSFGVGDG